ncbi:nucleoside hydrolase [Paenibacillus sp. N3/727]|uniref:nucleoside hydrolase n=1 Tax=Paenibacillus sp. N3/727 TaxID=2925845 RepID=UPI001F534160|nr:nucleoside hydrolase [Paenibacillus sp. N3/727]UNK19685.1 nucleoside hydrolase [Paenibacillus sp. N3/727]
MKPVIIDVDTGIDDALAIAYAAKSQELKLIGLTTCFGNIPVEDATRNSLLLAEMLGCDVPVIPGAEKPLTRASLEGYATRVHGNNGLGNAVAPFTPSGQALKAHAADFMIEVVRNQPNKITLIMVGPLTNLALAIQKDPEIVNLVDRVVVMGGAVRCRGNVTPSAEANIHADPEAAEYVFNSGISLTLVGLDVTMKTLLPREHLKEWEKLGTEFSKLFAEMTHYYMDAYEGFYPGIGGCALHDPLAVGVVINPEFVKTLPMRVDVITSGDAVGQTVEVQDRDSNIEVCVEVDEKAFLEHFLSRVM